MSAALNIGFLPLTDAAPLIAAVDFGLAPRQTRTASRAWSPARACKAISTARWNNTSSP